MCGDSQGCEALSKALQEHGKKLDRLASVIGNAARTINSYVDERLFSSNDTVIKLQPQSANPVLISAIIVTVSSNATLTLGDRIFNIIAGGDNDAQFKNVMFVLRQSDVRQLVQSVPGPMSLELMGIELPTTGIW